MIKQDAVICGTSSLEQAREVAANLYGDNDVRLVAVTYSPAAKQTEVEGQIYILAAESQICPCCRTRIASLKEFSGNESHADDPILEAGINAAAGS